jgi:hypothetical protein
MPISFRFANAKNFYFEIEGLVVLRKIINLVFSIMMALAEASK